MPVTGQVCNSLYGRGQQLPLGCRDRHDGGSHAAEVLWNAAVAGLQCAWWCGQDVKTKSIWSTIEAVTVWPNLIFFLNIHFHHLSHDVLGDVFTGSRCNPKCSQNRSKWLDSAWPFPEGSRFGPIFPWWKPFPIKNEKMPKSPEHILILITFLRT